MEHTVIGSKERAKKVRSPQKNLSTKVLNLNQMLEKDLQKRPPSLNETNIRQYTSSNMAAGISDKIHKKEVSTADLGNMIATIYDRTYTMSKQVEQTVTGLELKP